MILNAIGHLGRFLERRNPAEDYLLADGIGPFTRHFDGITNSVEAFVAGKIENSVVRAASVVFFSGAEYDGAASWS